MIKRELVKVYVPKKEMGFLGHGHTARPLVIGSFKDTDPFIALMDDDLDKTDYSAAGGPHPHAGFETVSLLVDGEIVEMLESMKKGDFQVMTAGSGIIHTETINGPTKGRLFQLWLNLPKQKRWTTPRLQIVPAAQVPVSNGNGVSIRVYSGSLAGLNSPIENYTPLIVGEVSMCAGISTTLQIPANFNAFIVVVNGSVDIGTNGVRMNQDQVGWLDFTEVDAPSILILTTEDDSVRLILYAGKPTGDPIVSHGPFIADSEEQIQSLYHKYRNGEMTHIADAPEEQRIVY